METQIKIFSNEVLTLNLHICMGLVENVLIEQLEI